MTAHNGDDATPQTTTQMRAQLKRRRQALLPQKRKAASQAIVAQLQRMPVFRKAHHVASYAALASEVDLSALMRDSGKHWYWPCVDHTALSTMRFVRCTPDTQFEKNRFGIVEPVVDENTTLCAPQQLDLVLAPLVGFDDQGHRLGMGGGYYDRSFAFLRDVAITRPRLIGVAFDCQRVFALTPQPWDVGLHGVVTEKGVYGALAHARVSS